MIVVLYVHLYNKLGNHNNVIVVVFKLCYKNYLCPYVLTNYTDATESRGEPENINYKNDMDSN